MKTIYLIGFMGSGKSTVGLRLAKKLNRSFIDTDDYIKQNYNMSIPDIFKKYGEQTFRQYEIEALRNTTAYSIIATGGGIVERKENILAMKNGTIIYLETSFEEIVNRLKKDQSRPLWKSTKSEQMTLYNKRMQMYKKNAHFTIETTYKTVDEVVSAIVSKMKNKCGL